MKSLGCGYCKHHELSPIYQVYNCKLKHMFVSIFEGRDCNNYESEVKAESCKEKNEEKERKCGYND